MDPANIAKIWEIAANLGVPGLVLVIWYFNDRRYARILEETKQQTAEILRQYRDDFQNMKQMYENNAELVRNYNTLADKLHSTVLLVASNMQRIEDAVKTNQFCPYVRLEKQAKGVQA